MKKIFIIILLLIPFISCLSQTQHNTKCSNCKYYKYSGPIKEGGAKAKSECGCIACNEKNEKERIAKQAEDKKVADQLAQRDKKLKEEREKALEEQNKKIAKEREDQKKNELVINNSVKKNTNSSNIKPEKVGFISDTILFVQGRDYLNFRDYFNLSAFLNYQGKVIIENKEWSKAKTVNQISYTKINNKNYGIVRIGDLNFYWKEFHFDFVNAKGDLLLNDNSVKSIMHLRDNWFLVSDSKTYFYLFNFETNEKIQIPFFCKSTRWDAHQNLVPVFSDKVIMNPRGIYDDYMVKVNESEYVKKMMISSFPDKVNETVLNRFLFVLFQSDYYNTYQDLSKHENIKRCNKIEMYGVTNEGKFETIRIK